ncbi:hypothetical protein [Reyranella sp.]|uniref:hypothetical protein n=1 Tax=Reyranella sp. TaxID=1929291 RepID=UPI003BADB69F
MDRTTRGLLSACVMFLSGLLATYALAAILQQSAIERESAVIRAEAVQAPAGPVNADGWPAPSVKGPQAPKSAPGNGSDTAHL